MAQHLHSNSRSAASEVVAHTLVALSLVESVAHSLRVCQVFVQLVSTLQYTFPLTAKEYQKVSAKL